MSAAVSTAAPPASTSSGTPNHAALATALCALLRGLGRAHGRYDPRGTDARGKVNGVASTLAGPLTPALWEAHLAGRRGVGVPPLLDDGTCVWGAIDVDVYDLDLPALNRRVQGLGLPLVVCRTKSGGAHLYLFLAEPVPATLVRSKLASWAAALGYPGVEVFPKQDRLGPEDTGNWLNAPYYGGAMSTRYALGPDGRALTPEEFVVAARAAAVTGEGLEGIIPKQAEDADPFRGAPPCLETLAATRIAEGARNNGIFNFAVYARKRYADDWQARVAGYNGRYLDPPLPTKELNPVVRSVAKRDYFYRCTQAPIHAVCDKDVCRTREFGIGGVGRGAGPYQVINGRLCYGGGQADAPSIPLCNFAVRIVHDQTIDDGLTTRRRWVMSGAGDDGRPFNTVTMDVEELTGAWWLGPWGARAAVNPTVGARHLLPAIQAVSAPVPERTIYAHLGWRQDGDRWLYLHADGAIGADGPVDGFEVKPEGDLRHYRLPVVRDPVAAVRASLGLLDLGVVGAVLLAATFAAPLAEFHDMGYAVFVAGASGVFKSAAAGIAQAHWGAHWADGRHFPANWSATANSLEKLAFIAKDAIFGVDDFAPRGTPQDVERQHQTADRLIRAQGNRGGRARMTAGGALRETFWPRGIVAASGEDVPKGHSLRARMVIVQVQHGDIDREQLTKLQRDAGVGLMAEAMAAYVRWLAGRAEGLSDRLDRRAADLRGEMAGAHARTPANISDLLLGAEQFLDLAVSVGAIDAEERDRLARRWRDSLMATAAQQDEEQESEAPAERFRDMLGQALAAGRAHVTDKDGGAPLGREEACGWHERTYFSADGWQHTAWDAKGDRIGRVDGDSLWLQPAPAFACAERLCRDQGRSLGLTDRTLGRRLSEAGMVISNDGDRHTKKVRTGTKAENLFHLKAADFLPAPTEVPGQDGAGDPPF